MEPGQNFEYKTKPRRLLLTWPQFGHGNLEAWNNVIRSYITAHPGHTVTLLYQGEAVANLLSLFKREGQLDSEGFQLVVGAPDPDPKNVPKLFRFLVEAAGPDYQNYLDRELYRVRKLF